MQLLRRIKPGIVTGIIEEFVAPAAKFLGLPCIIFTEPELVEVDNILTYLIATLICTPVSCKKYIREPPHAK